MTPETLRQAAQLAKTSPKEAYDLLAKGKDKPKDQIPGGLADKGPPKDLDPKELEMGIKVEMEHTDDKSKAREIALDHLTEIPDYYTRLKKMEDEAEGKEKHAMKHTVIRQAAELAKTDPGAAYALLDKTAAGKAWLDYLFKAQTTFTKDVLKELKKLLGKDLGKVDPVQDGIATFEVVIEGESFKVRLSFSNDGQRFQIECRELRLFSGVSVAYESAATLAKKIVDSLEKPD